MFDLQKKLAKEVKNFLEKKYKIFVDPIFDISQEKNRGDLTCSIALRIAKNVDCSPRDIASLIVDVVRKVDGVRSVEVAGSGYINVFVHSSLLIRALDAVVGACSPAPLREDVPPIIVDYSSPNIAKPLGVHHILSTVLGQVIVNLYRHMGYKTISINHIGDWGTQFGKLAVAYRLWATKDIEKHSLDDLLQLYVRFHDEAEKDVSLEDRGREAFLALEQHDEKMRSFWQSVVGITMSSMQGLYDRLHVSFDFTHGESFYEKMMAPIIAEGQKKNVFQHGEKGALIASFSDESKLPPVVIMKNDGTTIYVTRDLATMRYRIDRWHPSEILYVVDVAQSLYFQQLFAIVHQLGWDVPAVEHVSFGRMKFAHGNMSTRTGNVLRLEDVLDESVRRASALIVQKNSALSSAETSELSEIMGVGAVVYGVLSQNRKMDMIFDWDRFLSFEGNSAPYIQYTHARAKSVLRKASFTTVSFPDYEGVLTDNEASLVHLLLLFETVLESARFKRLPHLLSTYLFELCQAYNSFYTTDPILTAKEPEKSLRLSLTFLTTSVIAAAADILTLRVPDRM